MHALADAKALQRQMPNAEFITARSILELRTKPERLRPRILDFLHQAIEATAKPLKPGKLTLAVNN
jgi:hypothetical protein